MPTTPSAKNKKSFSLHTANTVALLPRVAQS